MGTIIPAILPSSRNDLVEKLSRLHALTDEVQIDSVDGVFAGTACWPYESTDSTNWFSKVTEDDAPELESFQYEVDLMVHAPEVAIAPWITLGASRVVVHAESTPYLGKVIEHFQKTYGHERGFTPSLLSFGLAISLDTEISMIEPFLHTCDFVQFMGIAHIGKQGESFDTRVLRKISAFKRAHPDMLIQVDGGVSLDSLPGLLQAGATRFIVGSALWNAPNITERFRAFEEIVDTHLYS